MILRTLGVSNSRQTDFFFKIFVREMMMMSPIFLFLLFLVVLTYGENHNNQHSKRIELDATNFDEILTSGGDALLLGTFFFSIETN